MYKSALTFLQMVIGLIHGAPVIKRDTLYVQVGKVSQL